MATSKYFKSSSCTSTQKNPAHEDEHGAADAHLSTTNMLDSLEKLFAEISKMNDMLQSVATDVSSIKQATAELNNTVTAMQERLGKPEGRIAHLEETAEQLLNNKANKDKQTEQLWNRVQALENQSRQNNVRLVGPRETLGTNETLFECVRKILAEGLGVNLTGSWR